jgi:tripartite ATP-independent transporter DctP family solute receptor
VAFTLSSAQARDLRLADVYPAGAPTVDAAEYMNKVVRERTDGRHSIEIHQADRDSETFTIASVRNGMLDMARINVAALNLLAPATVVPTLPYLFRSTAHMHRTLDGPIGEEILGSLSTVGLVGLCFYDLGARSFYSRTTAIRRPEALRGLMVRIQPGSVSPRLMQALGATPVAMPFDRIDDALRTGVIDAVDETWTTYVAAGHYRFAKHYALTKHSMAPGVLVISKLVWDQLPKPDQAIIRAAAKESAARLRITLDGVEREARSKAERDGVEVIDDIDRKPFADALRPLYPALLHDPKLLDMTRRIDADDEVARKP